ncbi:MAG: arginine repressor [Coriobacteriales bacterium]|jgi:transcriptional regulator of arginine metabolism
MAISREERQRLIRTLVRTERVRTQAQLVDALSEQGTDVTQATISRDVSDLGLEKDPAGYYAVPEDLRFNELVAHSATGTRRAGNQVLIFTSPGSANTVAAALDAAARDGVLGSIAGDDTILVITEDDEAGARFQESVDQLVSGRQR